MISQEYIPIEIRSFQELLPWWPFFLEGLEVLNRLPSPKDAIDGDTFLKTVLQAIDMAPSRGMVLIVTSKNDKPLFWGVAVDNTASFRRRTMCVHSIYQNGKAQDVTLFALGHLEAWARRQGYEALQAFSPCMSGSRFRLFEKRWKFRRSAILFTKDL